MSHGNRDNTLYDSESFWEHIEILEQSNLIPVVEEIGDGIGQMITSGKNQMIVRISDDDEYLSMQSIVQYKGSSVARLLSLANSFNNGTTGYTFFVIEEDSAIGIKSSLPVELGVTQTAVLSFITTFLDCVSIFADTMENNREKL
jgi:hypothetical protein